jgi:outer membrane protein, protease secretion system
MMLQTVMSAPPGEIALIDHSKLPSADGWGAVEEWIARAEKSNYNLAALRYELEAARQERQKALSGHYPSLDLFLTHRRASNEMDVLLDRGTVTSLVGVQMSLPIFSGGYTIAAASQAQSRIERARQRLEAGRREIDLSVRREFGNVRQNAAKAAALRQAVASTEQALLGTQKGVAAGTRTTPDVLNAQDLLFRTRADLERAGGELILSYLRLHEASGALDEKPIQAVNAWLAAAR